jgi:hypothetical protein
MSTEIGEHVEVTTTENASGLSRAGFGTQAIFDCAYATFPELSREYSDVSEMPDDGMTSKTPTYRAAQKAFAQKPRPQTVKVIRGLGKPTLKYRIDLVNQTPSVGTPFKVYVEGDSAAIADTTIAYTTKADLTFTAANATEIFTSVAHGMVDGDGPYRVSNAGGALPAGLAVDTDYWIDAQTVDTFKLATTKALALAGTPDVAITTDGTGTQTLRRNQNDVVIAQLKQGINAIASKNFTAVQQTGAGETDYLEVSGDVAGKWFSLEVDSIKYLKIEVTHAEPGTTIATDLDNVEEFDADWYGVTYPYPSDACMKAVANWCEAKTKVFIGAMSDSTIATTAATVGDGDTANDLKNLALARTAIIYHPNPAAFAGAAWMGRMLPTEPGRATWKFKTLKTVENVVLTTTQRTNIRNKNANTYTQVARNVTWTWEGTVADGDFIDITRNIDWLDDAQAVAVASAFDANDIIPMTEAGKQIVLNEVEGVVSEAITRGILSDDPDDEPVVTAPLISELADVDREDRILPDIQWNGRLAGAIHKAKIRGNVRV